MVYKGDKGAWEDEISAKYTAKEKKKEKKKKQESESKAESLKVI